MGGVLAVIAVGLGYLDRLSIFVLALPLAALGVWIVLKRKLANTLRSRVPGQRRQGSSV